MTYPLGCEEFPSGGQFESTPGQLNNWGVPPNKGNEGESNMA